MEKKIQVGQTIWLRRASTHGTREPIEAVVETVGKKYFTLVDRPREKYDLETLKQVVDSNYKNVVYLSLQTILDEDEFAKLSDEVRKPFQYYGNPKLTLDQLRRIKAILDEK